MKNRLFPITILNLLVFGFGGVISATAQEQGAKNPTTFTFSSGKSLMVRSTDRLNTKLQKTGDPVLFVTAQLIPVSKEKAIPAGMKIQGRIAFSKRAGVIHGTAKMGLVLEKMYLPDGTFLPFSVSGVLSLEKEAKDFWYSPLGFKIFEEPKVESGEIRLVGCTGGAPIISRGPDLVVMSGTPFIVVVAADINIPLDKIPLVDISPMCPCKETNLRVKLGKGSEGEQNNEEGGGK